MGRQEKGVSLQQEAAGAALAGNPERPTGSDTGRVSSVDIIKRLAGHFKVFGLYPRMMCFLGRWHGGQKGTLRSFLFQYIWESLPTVVLS